MRSIVIPARARKLQVQATLLLSLIFILSLTFSVAADGENKAQQGLDRLASIVGEWLVTGTMLDLSGKEVEIRSTATITKELGGASIEEHSSYLLPPHAVKFTCLRTWDSFRNRYRMACIDSLTGLLDIYEGEFDNGALVMTNLSTGTHAEINGTRMYGRQTVSKISSDSFLLTWDISMDRGSTWQQYGQLQYRRQHSK